MRRSWPRRRPTPWRLLRRAPRVLAFALEWAVGRRLLGPGEAAAAGLAVHLGAFPDAERSPLLARLGEAVALLEAFAPRAVRRLRLDGVRLLVAHQGSTCYWPATNVIAVRAPALAAQPASLTASELRHEGAHARLARAGVWPWPDLIARVERRCVTEQLGFLRALPPGEFPGAAAYADRLEEAARRPWWTARDRIRGIARALREGRSAVFPPDV